MKFGYMLDSSSYEPHFFETSSFSDALALLENRFNVSRLASQTPDIPFVEVWIDKEIERKDMSFEDLSEVYRLYPDSSGYFKCGNLCLCLLNELYQASSYIDYSGKLTKSLAGFSAGMHLKDIFKWLDDHTSHGVRSLIFGTPYSVSDEPIYLPCEYLSSWDGFGDVSSPAKYDPVNNKVYDVEIADISDDELAECEILAGEYMDLLGVRFSLGERSDDDTWAVEEQNPLYILSGIPNLRVKASLASQVQSASTRAAASLPESYVKAKEIEPLI